MFKIHSADRKALGVYSGLFIGGGLVMFGMGMAFYWLIISIGIIMGAVSFLARRKTRYKLKKWTRRWF